MTKFVALGPKSYVKFDGAEDKKFKGIKKCVMKKTLDFDDYKACLFNPVGASIYRLQLMFRNKKHEVHTVEANNALNRDDDKRITKKDGVSTLARGHSSLCRNSSLGKVGIRFCCH